MPESALLEGLNPAQRAAVAAVDGPLLVVAGAGSGKTRVLTRRVAHLIQDHGVSPFAILAITFTNKAASEMKERVGALVGGVVRDMWVSTFHSSCSRILRREAHRLGYRSSFSIYDQADSLRLITLCIKDLDMDPKRFPPRQIKAAISNAKNELGDFETYGTNGSGFYHEKVADVYRLYQQRLVEASAVDFDDPRYEPTRYLRHPVRYAETPANMRHHAPKLGEHTEALLAEAGFGADEISELRDAGAVR